MESKDRNRKFKLAAGIAFTVTILLLMKPFGIEIISETTFASIMNNTILTYIGGNIAEKGLNTYREIKYNREMADAYRDGA